jgi:glycosyltransferase involved in cell wall biosynthesis
VLTAIRAVRNVPRAELDIFGPLINLDERSIAVDRIRYCGEAAPAAVSAIMSEYDLLLFPTVWPGEGYPGVLVEAIQVGLPIIATNWQDLPEMFPGDEAWLVSPEAPEEIEALLRMILDRPALLREKSVKLLSRAPDFHADRVFSRFMDACAQAADRR